MRIYVKDKKKFAVAMAAFTRYCQEMLGGSPSKLRDIIVNREEDDIIQPQKMEFDLPMDLPMKTE